MADSVIVMVDVTEMTADEFRSRFGLGPDDDYNAPSRSDDDVVVILLPR